MRHFSETALLKITVGKKKHECLMKSYQEDLIRSQIKHVDFYEVTRGQTLRTMVSITLVGNPIGTREGGVLEQVLYETEIECVPKDLPETLQVDVSALAVNHTLALGEVVMPAGVKLLDDVHKTVASVKTVRAEVAAAEETGEEKAEEAESEE